MEKGDVVLTRIRTISATVSEKTEHAGGGFNYSKLNLRNTHLAAISALLYVVAFGMILGYPSPATVDMKMKGSRFRQVTVDEITWIASVSSLSAVVGNCISGYVSQKFGRKAVLMYVSAPFVAGWLMIAYAPSIGWIYAGRFISGFCSGISTVAVPAYVVEIATTETRGLLSSGFQVALSSGVFIMISMGIFLRWSWLAIVGAVCVTCGSVLMCLMPESPPWLIRQKKNDEALVGLQFLKGKHSDSMKELRDISLELSQEATGSIRLKDFLEPSLYKPSLIAICFMFFLQFSGINGIMSYSVEIFEISRSSLNSNVAATVIAAVQVGGAFLSSALVERAGRKVLYIASGIGMTIALTGLGVQAILSSKQEIDQSVYGLVPLISFAVYIGSFSLGFGPIPFVVTPEIVPIRSRSVVMAIANVSNSFFGFIVTKLFEDMRLAFGIYGLYWTYALMCIFGCVFCWFFVPETKGRTLDDIHKSFSASVEMKEKKDLPENEKPYA
ncbi:facilitated trehalose transporter Tret1-2 homolog isoform X2 [Stegodyphus dumicola]|uniref:facilitated trehalose transporter Tret1-2 homolog isoform X2 n=1 Tax=Stegodyphus dumicola TaxID=202533 RepID=UPI0015B37254|nr:facilitated trehalose transporter Tret1-2 homolog isoform X2 [Stegodyphus dumicola]